ncbi:hypothetical protein CDAR_56321 [Caerostris darwini]|uniref:Uncharacterized protein n=1 Tax=Caerostris darwini TaxID=1538125 RepID=A0AAV4WNH9_9ARAC|nr:hypothetical protein CDAR_56321 [Caerostris darwini]
MDTMTPLIKCPHSVCFCGSIRPPERADCIYLCLRMSHTFSFCVPIFVPFQSLLPFLVRSVLNHFPFAFISRCPVPFFPILFQIVEFRNIDSDSCFQMSSVTVLSLLLPVMPIFKDFWGRVCFVFREMHSEGLNEEVALRFL